MSDSGKIGDFSYSWDKNYHSLELILDEYGMYDPYISREHTCYLTASLGKECMVELRDFLDQKINECP